jgi:hypothetical protein
MSVVVIPKSAVLSTRSCTFGDHIPHAPHGHEATLALALALYSEQCVSSFLREFDRALPSRVPTPYICICFLRRLLLSHSRWAGYLQSLPNEQNWHGIALFWGAAASRGPLSSGDAGYDGRRVDSGGLDPDSDAVQARRWLRRTEAETHLLLPDSPRTPLLVCPFTSLTVTSSPSQG